MIFKRKKEYGKDILSSSKDTILKFQDEYLLARQNEQNILPGSKLDIRSVRAKTKLAQAKYAFMLRSTKEYIDEK